MSAHSYISGNESVASSTDNRTTFSCDCMTQNELGSLKEENETLKSTNDRLIGENRQLQRSNEFMKELLQKKISSRSDSEHTSDIANVFENTDNSDNQGQNNLLLEFL